MAISSRREKHGSNRSIHRELLLRGSTRGDRTTLPGGRDVDEIRVAVARHVVADGAIPLHLDVELLGAELACVEDDVLVLRHTRTVWRRAGRERGEEQ